jgi:hypothetical protein
MELSVHEDQRSVAIALGPLLVAKAYRCPVVTDHWWLVTLDAEGSEALDALRQLVDRLRSRHGTRVSVAPDEVRPDLGRAFFAQAGFGRSVSDLTDTCPLEFPLSQ